MLNGRTCLAKFPSSRTKWRSKGTVVRRRNWLCLLTHWTLYQVPNLVIFLPYQHRDDLWGQVFCHIWEDWGCLRSLAICISHTCLQFTSESHRWACIHPSLEQPCPYKNGHLANFAPVAASGRKQFPLLHCLLWTWTGLTIAHSDSQPAPANLGQKAEPESIKCLVLGYLVA
jgi:hypothetical protein